MMNARNRSTHRSGATCRLLPLLIAALGLVAACSTHGAGSQAADAGAELEECRTYLDAYAACMRRLSPRSPQVADARIATARLGLARVTDREELRQTCVNGTTQMRASCQ
jgi:hypothetical protein